MQLAFRKSSVVEAITNSDYFGEIAQMGDSVKIIKEPEITVKSYARGTTITPQDLDDEDLDDGDLYGEELEDNNITVQNAQDISKKLITNTFF